ncbi:MAG: hypothetical protein KGY70_19675 [Bacteroidales bacterium]|nr:hypothetical protein [Bacteroidales bacterium]
MKFQLQWSNEGQTNLWTPEHFIGASKEEILKAIGRGGCGPGKLGDKFVPDSIWGLNVHPACKRHDMGWYLSETEEEYVISDNMFLCNLLRLNDSSGSNKLIKWLRLHGPYGMYSYYEAVAYLGR